MFNILFSGCYSYFLIHNTDISQITSEKKVKIILKDKKEIIVNNLTEIEFSGDDEIILTRNDSTKMKISILEIDKILEKKFDTAKTLFSILWILGGILALLIITIMLSTGGEGIRIG